MREILFRSKSCDKGEWIEGWYVPALDDGRHCIFLASAPDMGEYVDPQTVGQYTGLEDKNGKKIFEGDIVHCTARLDESNCLVIFEEGEFRLVPERLFKTYVTGGGYHALRCFEKEVIGNIHDNPELLEEIR